MSKILIEDLTNNCNIEQVNKLAAAIFQSASAVGLSMAMNAEEILLALLFSAKDMELYSLFVGIVTEDKLLDLNNKALELAKIKLKEWESNDIIKEIKEAIEKARTDLKGKFND
jgi:hypothetical protein